MEVIYHNCCGIDVHKSFLIATIIKTTDGLTPKYIRKRFSTFNRELLLFKEWLISHDCLDVCMESTGKYWIPVSNILEGTHRVVVANPKWVKTIKGNKDDKKDSKWIGDLFRVGLVPGSYIPDKPIRILREYTRYRSRLISMRSSEKLRYYNALTVCNIGLDSVVSDMYGVSATKIIDYILDCETIDLPSFINTLHGSMRKKSQQIIDAIEGFQMSFEQATRIKIIKDTIQSLDNQIIRIETEIDKMIVQYQTQIDILCTNYGFNRRTAISTIAEIGIDMSQFGSADRLCSWAGLTPGNNESAGKKKSVRTSKAGVYLKPALVQAAHAAVKSTKNAYYKIKYERIAKRRGKKRAIVAIARMMLVACYHMLSTGELFNPRDIDRILNNVASNNKQDKINESISLLQSLGFVIT